MHKFDAFFETIRGRLETIADNIGKEFGVESEFYEQDDGSGFHLELTFGNQPVYVTAMLIPEEDVEFEEAERGNLVIRIEDYRGECQTYAAGNYTNGVWLGFDDAEGFDAKLNALREFTSTIVDEIKQMAEKLEGKSSLRI